MNPTKRSKMLTTAAAAFLVFTGGLAAAGTAGAADCPSGEFCAWEHAEFKGQRANWSGDDGWWESWIADEDSSWANHGISGPGIKDHVKVYSRAQQGGHMTICLTPGQEVNHNSAANDNGDSHTWAMSC
ncbi:peptidase inhibitor family I36 protein [Streptomyces sp. NPDC059851]|uniref:peptidase inhibitor family I36 protein n=1 Tax=Streptomyces sp. NPDC059851 TaxID=3346971 RepID=UPI003666B8C0